MLKEYQQKIKEAVFETANSHGRNAARNAIQYLERAFAVNEIDPEIAVFMAITAEEEAATASFLSLKKRAYAGADQINHHDHRHKAALYPFCTAVRESLVILKELKPVIIVQPKSPEKISVKFVIQKSNGENFDVAPDSPFNFAFKINDTFYDFSRELNQISEQFQKNLFKIIEEIANFRNKVLYASANGILKIEKGLMSYLEQQHEKTYWLLILFLTIECYPQQIFVQQTLNTFLKLIKKLPDESSLDTLLDKYESPSLTLQVDLNNGVVRGVQSTKHGV